MEKAADAVDAVCANFFYSCAYFFGFERVFQNCLPFLCNFWHFCSFLHASEHFLHIFCVLFFSDLKFYKCYFVRFFHLCFFGHFCLVFIYNLFSLQDNLNLIIFLKLQICFLVILRYCSEHRKTQ